MKVLAQGQPPGAAVVSPTWRWPVLVATAVLLGLTSAPGDRPVVLGMSAGLFAMALVAGQKSRRASGLGMPPPSSQAPTAEPRRPAVADAIEVGVLDQAADCIQWIDCEGRLLASNRAGLPRSLGAADGMVGKPWSLGWGPAATEAFDAAMTGRAGRFQASRQGANGEPAWWDVLVTPVRDANAGIVRLLAIGRDVTEAHAADDERTRVIASERAARSEAERTTRMKDEFVGTLSHELRTPLNAILGWLDVLKQDRSDATLTKALDVIDRNSRRQVQMIDDLLDVSRLISGKVRLDVRRTDLGSVIDEAVASAQPEATVKGVQLVQRLHAPTTIEGDASRVLQILRNLVANAIKFTPPGGVVQVTLRHAGTYALVQVTDTGRGIRADVLPYIFERFQQGDTSATRQSSGLGLGLAIVKNLVELHHGTVAAASEGEGLGSTFSVQLPLVIAGDTREAVEGQTDDLRVDVPTILRDLGVLVLDDEPDARDLARRILEDAGASVTVATSAQEALALLEQGLGPDIIVSDIGLPEQDGYQFMQRVRSMAGRVASVPAAALTALARAEDRKRALMSGYQTHLAKPVDAAELVATVASLAGRTGGRKGAAELQ